MPFTIVIEMPGPPRGKGAGRAFATTHGARVFTDERTRKYESQLRFFASQAMAGRPPIKTACSVEIEARVQIPVSFSKRARAAALAGTLYPTTKPDCNNYSKILDALNGVVWEDDKQIVREVVAKVYAESPSLIITIKELETITNIEAKAALTEIALGVLDGPLFTGRPM